jgi:hypothetical protein
VYARPADSVVSGAIVPIRRADRLFDILRILRSAKAPVTAASIADELEVTNRWTEVGLTRDRCRQSDSPLRLFDQPVSKPSNRGLLQGRGCRDSIIRELRRPFHRERLYQPL